MERSTLVGLSKQGWRRAGFELAIVFFGVLIALLVDGWTSRRMERELEQEYIVRLLKEVRNDTTILRDLLRTLDTKPAALRWLEERSESDLRAAARPANWRAAWWRRMPPASA